MASVGGTTAFTDTRISVNVLLNMWKRVEINRYFTDPVQV